MYDRSSLNHLWGLHAPDLGGAYLRGEGKTPYLIGKVKSCLRQSVLKAVWEGESIGWGRKLHTCTFMCTCVNGHVCCVCTFI